MNMMPDKMKNINLLTEPLIYHPLDDRDHAESLKLSKGYWMQQMRSLSNESNDQHVNTS
jgi:hypothetical protein